MQIEPIAIYFEIPATDPMGYEHVEGKIRGLDDNVVINWKIRDRTFNKDSNPMHETELDYHEIEDVSFSKKFFSRKCLLEFRIGDPTLLEGMPGMQVGKCSLHVTKESREDAERLAKFLDYKVSEHLREESEKRLNDLLDGDTGTEI